MRKNHQYLLFLFVYRGGKALYTFDGLTLGDKIAFNSFNNSTNDDGGIELIGGAQIDNAVLFGASTSNLKLDQSNPVKQYAKFYLEEMTSLQNDMHQEICFETFFYATNAVSGSNQFIFSSNTLGVYLDPTGKLQMGVAAEKVGSLTASIITQPGGALAAHSGLGPISATGVLSSVSWYHVAVTSDGLKFNIFVNGYLYSVLDFIDTNSHPNGVYEALLVTNLSWVTNTTFMCIGIYTDEVSSPFDGYISYFAVKPYNKYRYDRFDWSTINSPIYFVPTLASVSTDVVRTDRYFQQYGDGADLANEGIVMFNFDTISTTEGVRDFYNNTIRFVGGNEALGGPYLDTTQKKFGTSSLRFPGYYTGGFPASTGYQNVAIFNMPNLNGKEFTFEFWVRPNGAGDPGGLNVSVTSNTIFRQDTYNTSYEGLYIGMDPAGNDVTVQFGNTVTGDIGSLNTAVDAGGVYAGTFTPGAWHHLAVTGRHNATNDGFLYCFFVDGNKIGEISSNLSLRNNDWGFFGTDVIILPSPINFQFRGWIDDVHCIQVCKYTTAFTPPTVANVPTDYGVTPTGTNVPGTFQYYYDIPTGIMYKGYSGNWSPVVGIFIGEAYSRHGTKTEKILSYTVGTKMKTASHPTMINDSGLVSFYHNFGTRKVKIQAKGRLRADNGAFRRGYEFDIISKQRFSTDFSHFDRVAAFRNRGFFSTMVDTSLPGNNLSDKYLSINAGSTSTLGYGTSMLISIFFEVERLF
jgi:hypothetical protein